MEMPQGRIGHSIDLNLAFRKEQIGHPMDGMGFVIPTSAKKALIAASFSHRKFAARAPEGFALLRIFLGGSAHETILELDDTALIRTVRDDLRSILVIEGDPVFAGVCRWPKSMAQYTLGHLDRVADIEREVAALPGLHLLGNAFRGIGIPDMIAAANRGTQYLFPGSDRLTV